MQKAGPRHAHRHQPWLAERPHYESLWRFAARHGGERPGVCPHCAPARLPQFQVLHEGQQPQDHDPVLPVAGRAPGARGAGLELPHTPWGDRSRRGRRWPHQERHWHRLALMRRPGRYDPRFPDRGFPPRNRGLPRFAGANPSSDPGSRCLGSRGRKTSRIAAGSGFLALRPVQLCPPPGFRNCACSRHPVRRRADATGSRPPRCVGKDYSPASPQGRRQAGSRLRGSGSPGS